MEKQIMQQKEYQSPFDKGNIDLTDTFPGIAPEIVQMALFETIT
jgi:hypothetical protein